jgi:hypothetical protein
LYRFLSGIADLPHGQPIIPIKLAHSYRKVTVRSALEVRYPVKYIKQRDENEGFSGFQGHPSKGVT